MPADITQLEILTRELVQLRRELDEAKERVAALERENTSRDEYAMDELDDEPSEINRKQRTVQVQGNGAAYPNSDGGVDILPSDRSVVAIEDDDLPGDLFGKIEAGDIRLEAKKEEDRIRVGSIVLAPAEYPFRDTYTKEQRKNVKMVVGATIALTGIPGLKGDKGDKGDTGDGGDDRLVAATSTDVLASYLYDASVTGGGGAGKLLSGDGIQLDVVSTGMAGGNFDQIKIQMKDVAMDWDGSATMGLLGAGEYWYLSSVEFVAGVLTFHMSKKCLKMTAESA